MPGSPTNARLVRSPTRAAFGQTFFLLEVALAQLPAKRSLGPASWTLVWRVRVQHRVWFHSVMQPENSADVVRAFLRGQNLEQIGKVDEAIDLYEAAVTAEFDSSGPYDRLIHLYADMARHRDVVRVAEAAIAKVQTYEDKKAWYEQMRAAAIKAQTNVPRPAPKNPEG